MLEMKTPVNDVTRRDLEMADPTLLDPLEPDSLVQGEWLKLNAAGKGIRATAANQANVMQFWTEKGDTSAQAIGKGCVIMQHEYEAETDMYDGAGSYAVDTMLCVKTVTIDGQARGALAVAATGEFVHAIVTRPPQLNRGKLRYQKRSPFVKPA